MLIPFVSYAEIHYLLPFLKPRYYKKQPEILADIPHRSILLSNKRIPLLILVKDADKFPILLKDIKVFCFDKGQTFSFDFSINEAIEETYFSKIIYIDASQLTPESLIRISVQFTIEISGNELSFYNDNYKTDKFTLFECFITNEKLPFPENWFGGDPHYHSNFTSDQIEFGADIGSTKIMAQAIGLDWFFVTDHSYDLDDSEESYLVNDDSLPKWKKMIREANSNDSDNLRIIHGEEISIGNNSGKNIHLLSIESKFVSGYGDSGENGLNNSPTNKFNDIDQNDFSLLIAAHPAEKPSLAEKLILRRDKWNVEDIDCLDSNLFQFFNSFSRREIDSSMKAWVKLLLSGRKLTAVAGNDAHGGFNFDRHVKIPFLSLGISRDHVFGKLLTFFNHSKNDPIIGLKKGRIVISNGPFVDFCIHNDKEKCYIGDIYHGKTGIIKVLSNTAPEFGYIEKIILYLGDINSHKETSKIISDTEKLYAFPKHGYARLVLMTSNKGIAITNPIWIEN